MDVFRKGKTTMKDLVSSKKRVVFEDEKEKGEMEERAFLDSVLCPSMIFLLVTTRWLCSLDM